MLEIDYPKDKMRTTPYLFSNTKEDMELLKEALSKVEQLIPLRKDNDPIIKYANLKYCYEFLKDNLNKGYKVVAFANNEDTIVGVVLLSEGYPWYSNTIFIVNEEFTCAFEKGYGIARELSELLKFWVDNGRYDYAQTASFNDWCSGMLKNTYLKEGFKMYNSFYYRKGL